MDKQQLESTPRTYTTKHGTTATMNTTNIGATQRRLVELIDNQRGRRNLTKQAWLDLGFKRAELLKPAADAARLAGNARGGKSSLTLDPTSSTYAHAREGTANRICHDIIYLD